MRVRFARLAQLVEHMLDVHGVTGSSPVPRTKKSTDPSGRYFFYRAVGREPAVRPTTPQKYECKHDGFLAGGVRARALARSCPVPRTKIPTAERLPGFFFFQRGFYSNRRLLVCRSALCYNCSEVMLDGRKRYDSPPADAERSVAG